MTIRLVGESANISPSIGATPLHRNVWVSGSAQVELSGAAGGVIFSRLHRRLPGEYRRWRCHRWPRLKPDGHSAQREVADVAGVGDHMFGLVGVKVSAAGAAAVSGIAKYVGPDDLTSISDTDPTASCGFASSNGTASPGIAAGLLRISGSANRQRSHQSPAATCGPGNEDRHRPSRVRR